MVARDDPSLRIWLLGGFRVVAGGAEVRDRSWRLRKAKAVVKLLALAPGHHLHRDELADLLWGDVDADAARGDLRQALHHARRALGADGRSAIALRDEVVALGPDLSLWIDVDEFQARLADARERRDVAAYEAALAVYRGDLLPEDQYEDWAAARREELRAAFLAALRELAGLHERRGETALAIQTLVRALAVDRTSEETHAALMRLYASSGQRDLALSQYDRLAGILRGELGVQPARAVERLRAEIVAGRLVETLPEAPRHNLPAALTSFVGRELGELRELLGRTRLLTLVGPGGCGKTRLALEAAWTFAKDDRFRDGVWLVELEALADPHLMLSAVSAGLGLGDRADGADPRSLARHVRARELLVVLDGCEHLLQETASIAASLLREAPELRILATSRESLALPGELRWPTPPLPVPPADATSLEDITRYAAVRLFVERARLADPHFTLDAESAADIGGICRQLDGLPLAIELAAAHARTLATRQIAERLDDRFRLLVGQTRGVAARHRTLRAVVDWSYERLGEAERTVFQRVAVFAGSFDVDAAEAVVADGALARDGVLDLLARLVDRSLLIVDGARHGVVRYSMLLTLREYARERLLRSGEAPAIAVRHASYFLDVAERATAALDSAEQRAWLARVDLEHDNLRAALAFALGAPDAALGLRLATALARFWYARGHLAEGRQWLARVLALEGDGTERAAALGAAALLAREQADTASARAFLAESARIYGERGRPQERADTLLELGVVSRRDGDLDTARRSLEESARIFREVGREDRASAALRTLGLVACERDDAAGAAALASESLAIERRLGNARGAAAALNVLGYAAQLGGDLAEARARYADALSASREADSKPELIWSLSDLGLAAALEGDLESARACLDEAIALAREIGDDDAIAALLLDVAIFAIAAGLADRGYRLAGASAGIRESLRHALPIRERLARGQLAAAKAELGDEAAEARWREGRRMSADAAVAEAIALLGTASPAPPPV